MNDKAMEILIDRIEELEIELSEYKEIEENNKKYEEWKWRQVREMSIEENLGLPIPRLEIRVTFTDFGYSALYALIYKHFTGEILINPLGHTRVDCGPEKRNFISLPHRDGAHIIHDKEQLKLPAYLVCNNCFVEVINRDTKIVL